MSRKHFNFAASRLQQIQDVKARRVAAEAFADIAEQTNPAFKRDMFMTACGL